MKKLFGMTLALIMCVMSIACADDAGLDDDIEQIVDVLTKAQQIEAYGTQMDIALKNYREIIQYANEHPALKSSWAINYINYADGRVKLDEGKYQEALVSFRGCMSIYVENVTYFIKFLEGIQHFENEEYEAAYASLNEASACNLLYKYGVNTLRDRAENKWNEIVESSKEEELRKKLEEEQKAAQEKEAERRAKATLSFSLKSVSENAAALSLSWENPINTYIVAVSLMAAQPLVPASVPSAGNGGTGSAESLSMGKPAFWRVDEHNSAAACSFTVTGLWPGTKYYIWLMDAEQAAAPVCKTYITSLAPEHTAFLVGKSHLLYQCDKAAYQRTLSSLQEGVSPHGQLYQNNDSQRVGDKKTILVSNSNLVRSGYYLIITLNMDEDAITGLKKELTGKKTELLLHISDCGSAKIEGPWPLAQTTFVPGANNFNKLTLYLSDLLDQFDDIPANAQYSVDFLIDGMLVYSFDGVTQ